METGDRGPDEGDSTRELPEYELSVETQNDAAETAEVAVPAGVSGATETMVRAVHFDDETQ